MLCAGEAFLSSTVDGEGGCGDSVRVNPMA